MGIDLIVTTLIWPEDATLDWDAGREWLRELPAERLLWMEDNNAWYWADGLEDEDEQAEEIRKNLLKLVDEAEELVTKIVDAGGRGGPRDVDYRRLYGLWILIAGGESSGDQPGDLGYSIISDLHEVAYLNDDGEWSRDDSLVHRIGFFPDGDFVPKSAQYAAAPDETVVAAMRDAGLDV